MNTPADDLEIWTVYRDPADYPGKYVVRSSRGATKKMFVTDSLAKARALVPPGLYRMPRRRDDDSVIVETWL